MQNEPPIRFVWNNTPNSKLQQARSIIHPAVHYTPYGDRSIEQVNYQPLYCTCQAILNKYCEIDYMRKTIKCCFCGVVTNLPPQYAKQIDPNHLPYEFIHEELQFVTNSKVQDDLPATSNNCLLFVVDLCLSEKEINAVKEELVGVLKGLPQGMFVGLITFNRYVNVLELSSKINTEYRINGVKEYNIVEIMGLLGINIKADPSMKSADILKRFIIPLRTEKDVDKVITRVKDMKKDPFIYVNQRSSRALGQALNIAISIAEAAYVSPRIVMLIGGPCTAGPGMVISQNLKELMRSPRELINGENIKYFATAKKYYDSLLRRIISKRIIIDMFAFCLEEIGLAEMSELVMSSGGFVVMHEEFSDHIFKNSFKKIFQNVNATEEAPVFDSVTEGTLSVFASKDVSINGALGQCYSLNKTKYCVSDKQIGKGKTHAWYLGSMDRQKTITILYETKQSQTKQNNYFLQLKTNYRTEDGRYAVRVITVRKQWTSIVPKIVEGFDKEAAIVFLARLCVHKSLMEEQQNIRQWLDTSLCKWASYFGNYVKGDIHSFSLSENMRLFPQFIYHLRRSSFVNRFGSSLDESFYRGFLLGRESVDSCVTMVQPVLLKYSLEGLEPEGVQLDEEEMQAEVILLLDSYFNVIEWYGDDVQSWWEEKYHETQGYQHIKQLLDSPKMDINYIMNNRFPAPNYYLTHPYHSKQRYLKSRVNPKKSHGQQHENTITDDTDLKGFSQHLVKVVTSQAMN